MHCRWSAPPPFSASQDTMAAISALRSVSVMVGSGVVVPPDSVLRAAVPWGSGGDEDVRNSASSSLPPSPLSASAAGSQFLLHSLHTVYPLSCKPLTAKSPR